MLRGVRQRLAHDRIDRLEHRLLDPLQIATDLDHDREVPPHAEVADERGECGLGRGWVLARHLEQELADASQVVADLPLDLLQRLGGTDRVRLDPVTERLELEDRGRHRLGQPVVDLHRPARALLEHQHFHGVADRRVSALSTLLRLLRAGSPHSCSSVRPVVVVGTSSISD